MTELETQTSHISKWVDSIRIPNRKDAIYHSMVRAQEYIHRIEKTKKKIQSLIDALQPYLKKFNGSRNGGYMAVHVGDGTIMDANDILDDLHKTIGVYQISGRNDKVWWEWRKRTGEGIGSLWFDYLGNQSIRESGGYVVVMLSDEGIEFLNKIAKEVLSISSHTTV